LPASWKHEEKNLIEDFTLYRMSLLSSLRKNKQESSSDDNAYFSRAEEESSAVRTRSRRKQGAKGKEPIDPVLPEKKRARRRLIGAIALVLAAIIGLPMFLDSEPKPLADDIAIQIPSKDKPARPNAAAERQPAPPAAPASSKVSASSSLDPEEEVVEPATSAAAEPAPAQKKPAAPAAPIAPLASSVTPQKPKEDIKQEIKPAKPAKPAVAEKPAAPPVKAESKPEPKPEPKVAEKNDDSARAIALLEGKSEPKAAAEKKPEKFVVQVAALASKEKVNELQAKLKEAGIRSYTQTVATSSGERIRIRVGPFGSREDADKARSKIVKLGLNGTLVPA
jgi:DedD protein